MTHLAPLVCRPQPYPDESLLSFLVRVQVANGYEGLVWLTEWLRDKTRSRIDLHPTSTNQAVFLENLATVTTIPVRDLYQLTLNRYLHRLTLSGGALDVQPVSSGEQLAFCPQRNTLKRWFRTEEATAFCPQCLREAPYHRLQWLLDANFACPEHHCWLLDTCLTCGATLSVASILRGQCDRCSASLTEMPVMPLDTEVARVQQDLITCLETDLFPADTLPPMTMPAFFRLLDGLCAVTRTLGENWEGCYRPFGGISLDFPVSPHRRLSTIQLGCLYTRAWPVVQDWPDGFHDFLDRYRHHLDGHQDSIRHSLGPFYSTWLERLWRHPDLEPVQVAFNEYFVTRYRPSRQIVNLARLKRYPELRERMKWMDVRNAARVLGISDPTITRMVRDGYVRAYYPQGKPSEGGLFVYRDDLEQGWQQRSAAVTTGQVVREFFSTHGIVNEWIAAGLITQTGSRLVRGVSQPSFTRQDVDNFINRLAQHVCLELERPDNAKTLKQVCISNTQIGMTVTHVFQRMLAGKLKAYHPHPRLQPFNQLWFDAGDVDGLMEQVKAENNWIALREIPLFLHVELKIVRHWVKTDLLVPVTTVSRSAYFDRTAVDAFRQRILRVPDVVNLLETNESSLWRWTRAGYLPLLRNPQKHQGRSYLFDRDAIDQWRAQYVTPTEARRILGASRYIAFRNRVVAGNYPSSVPQDMFPKFYYRTVLEQFQTELAQ